MAEQPGGAAQGTIKLKLVRSLIGNTERQRATVRSLGLRKMHQVVVHRDSPEIRGMVNKVHHLVQVVEE
jgi:large subunit ribosomal protein L30